MTLVLHLSILPCASAQLEQKPKHRKVSSVTWNKVWIMAMWLQYEMNLYPAQHSAFYTAKLSWTF